MIDSWIDDRYNNNNKMKLKGFDEMQTKINEASKVKNKTSLSN